MEVGFSSLKLNVAVAVTDDALDRIAEVAAACRARGFEHRATLAGIGVLTGSVGWGDLRKLRAVVGVMAVEVERRSLINRLSARAGHAQCELERLCGSGGRIR
jgi:hypothetical protein